MTASLRDRIRLFLDAERILGLLDRLDEEAIQTVQVGETIEGYSVSVEYCVFCSYNDDERIHERGCPALDIERLMWRYDRPRR